jgi:hypothetical protein
MSNHVSQTGYKPTKTDLKGLFNLVFETAGGLTLDCYLEYEAEERETRDEPGSPALMGLVWALVEGVDISEVLGDLAETIEEEALSDLESQIKDAALERGAA